MDLRQLRYFVVVAEERSVTRAAARLHLTQPPLSAQLARLEHELGVALLVRHRRGVDLTEAGSHLLEHAQRLLASVDVTTDSVRKLGEGRAGRLSIAFVSATAWTVLSPLLRRYHTERPDVVLDFVEDGPDGVVEHVRARRADVGVVHLPPPGVGAGHGPDFDVADGRSGGVVVRPLREHPPSWRPRCCAVGPMRTFRRCSTSSGWRSPPPSRTCSSRDTPGRSVAEACHLPEQMRETRAWLRSDLLSGSGEHRSTCPTRCPQSRL